MHAENLSRVVDKQRNQGNSTMLDELMIDVTSDMYHINSVSKGYGCVEGSHCPVSSK